MPELFVPLETFETSMNLRLSMDVLSFKGYHSYKGSLLAY
jgi:hypothetical protein